MSFSDDHLTLTFAAGAPTATVTLTPVNDTAMERPRDGDADDRSGQRVTRWGAPRAAGTIADNDAAPTVSASPSDGTGAEHSGDPITFTVTRSGSTAISTAVTLTWSGTAALTPTTPSAVAAGVTLGEPAGRSRPRGATIATVTITPVNDAPSSRTRP